jgi:5-methylthioadenosine/S-adenosylhomocysteine deaminase
VSVLESFPQDGLITFTLAPHAPYSVSDKALGRIADNSADRGLKVHLHCLETGFDVEHSIRHFGIGPLKRLSNHGLLNESLIAVHMTQLREADISLVAERGTHVVHCPQSNLKLASGICPIAALEAAGVNVCIGTDGAASNNNLDLLEEARFAALLAKGVGADATVVDATQVIDMLTINGAIALGLEAEIGSIEVGKKADLCALDLASPQTQPVYDVISQIVYAASNAQCTDVWIDGKRILHSRALTSLNEPEILAAAEFWRSRLSNHSQSTEAIR